MLCVMITESEKEALEEAISVIGSQVALAKLFNIKPQSVNQWLLKGVPAERVLSIEMATKRKGHKVSRYKLKPSIFNVEI